MKTVLSSPTARARTAASRSALLGGAAVLAIAYGAPAQAQDPVYLDEGTQIENLILGPQPTRVVVDISRADRATGELNLGATATGGAAVVTGDVTDNGGAHQVWLQATSTRKVNVIRTRETPASTTPQYVSADGVQFTGGTVYEASGNATVLTLGNANGSDPSKDDTMVLRDGPLLLAGDGTVNIALSLNVDGQPNATQSAIYVMEGSSSQARGQGGDGKLDVVISSYIQGDVTTGAALVDVQNAASVRLAAASRLLNTDGVNLYAGKSNVTIDKDALIWVSYGSETSGADGVGVVGSGVIINNGEIRTNNGLNGRPANAIGVLLRDGGILYNKTEQGGLGKITGGLYGVHLYDGANQVFNEGLITSENGAGIRSDYGTAVVRNGVSGIIRGNILNSSKIAYQGGADVIDFLVNSGVIEGGVNLGGFNDFFLYTGASNGVTGTIDGGAGDFDAYGRSFSSSADNQLSNAILNSGNNIGFEAHGVEARGTGTVVTTKASETLTNGLALVGDGTVINEASITADVGLSATRVANVPGALKIINRGRIIAGDYGVVGGADFASFRNEGTIISQGYGVYLGQAFDGDRTQALIFENTGSIEGTHGFDAVYASAASWDDPAGLNSSFFNSGSIRQTLQGLNPTESDSATALSVYGGLNRGVIRFVNDGFVEATGSGSIAARFDAGNMELSNTRLIDASGQGGMALFVAANGTPDMFARVANSGTIRANGGGFTDGNEHVLAAALGVRVGGRGRAVDVANTGVIEALGASSTAVLVNGRQGEAATQTFNFVNNGNIHGAADTVFAVGEEFADRNVRLADSDLGDDSIQRTIAGAIQTVGTTDNIRNNNLISGNVDLADGDDRFEHYGAMQGDVRMGAGNDTFLLGAGVLGTGKRALGGDGDDTLLIDASLNADRTIDGAVYRGFELIRRTAGATGTGKVFVSGEFDALSLNLDGATVYVRQDDAVDTQGSWVFYGGAGNESIYNDGVIAGHVSLGGGDDTMVNTGMVTLVTMEDGDNVLINSGAIAYGFSAGSGADKLTNSGSINGNVTTGGGDDTVINSGTINGSLNLGAGDDRYEATGAGKVRDGIEGGDGNDTFVFRLAGATGSIPGGFDGFESFAAYGPGTLQMALTRDYDTLEILEGANLDLTNTANWTIDLIKGDDSSQTVKVDEGFDGGVSLLGGDDTLEMSLDGAMAGELDGGDGQDTLRLNLTGTSKIHDLSGFEDIQVSGAHILALTGELAAGQTLTFDGSDNEFIVGPTATFRGAANGGAGSDTLRVTTGAAGERTIVSGQLTSFENIYSQGQGTLAFEGGSYNFDSFQATDGNLSVSGGASLSAGAGGIRFTGAVDNRFTLGFGSTVGSLVDGGDGEDVLAFAQAAGQTQMLSAVQATNFEVLAASGAGELHIDKDATFDTVQLEGGNIKLLADVTLTADVIGGAGNDQFDNGGTVDGDVLLGDGDDTYVARTGSSVTGTVDGGVGGNDTVVYSLNDGAGSLLDNVINFESIGVYGPGTLSLELAADYNSITLMDGANLDLEDMGGSVGQIIGDESDQVVNIGSALTGGVSLGAGNDTLNLTLGGVLSGALDGGEGTDTLNLALTSTSTINGMQGFEIANIAGDHALTLAGELGAGQRINFDGSDNELIVAAGAVFKGTVDGGAGQNLLRIQSGAADSRTVLASQIINFQDLVSEGSGTLALTGGAYSFDSVVASGNLELGAGTTLASEAGVAFDGADNRFTMGSGASVTGGVDGGDGSDTLALAQAQGVMRTLSSVGATSFERLETSGAGELRLDMDAVFAAGVSLDGGAMTLLAGRTLAANVSGGAGAETFAMLGDVTGDVDLGDGDDRLVVGGPGGSGLRSGGAGSNTLEFRTAGTYTAPTVYDASRYQNFDRLTVSGGVLSMTSDSSWKALSIAGGRLIGQAGTTISSEETIQVAHGATFGSAGTINADIDVAGTLSPGASPGTMTVNGDVRFLAGSNLLLEVSPTASDLLHITGGLTIAAGASVDITGVLTNTPGAVLDLIVADGGITGRFTTINKSSTIFGFVAQNGNKLQIRGEFQNDAAYSANVQASIAYANRVLASGQAVQAFTAAVPVLVDANGVSSAAAFGQLTPEAYGSAGQIATHNALSLVDSTRGFRFDAPEEPGLYGFAQVLGTSSELSVNLRTGASAADMDSQGVVTGVGYSTASGLRGGVFVGQATSDQELKALDASTQADSFVAGAFADMEIGAWGVHGVVAYDQADLETTRRLTVAAPAAEGAYALNTWVADASFDYRFVVQGVTLAPRAGVTYLRSERGDVVEGSANPFALAVDGQTRTSLFADVGVSATAVTSVGGYTLKPYMELGLRQRLTEEGAIVSGRLASTQGHTLSVSGLGGERTMVQAGGGVSIDLARGVQANLGYIGAYGGNTRHTVSGAISFRF